MIKPNGSESLKWKNWFNAFNAQDMGRHWYPTKEEPSNFRAAKKLISLHGNKGTITSIFNATLNRPHIRVELKAYPKHTIVITRDGSAHVYDHFSGGAVYDISINREGNITQKNIELNRVKDLDSALGSIRKTFKLVKKLHVALRSVKK